MAARFPRCLVSRRLASWSTVLLLTVGLLTPGVLFRPPPAAAAVADAAVVVAGRQWFVRGGPSFAYGVSTDVQFMGDWDGDGDRTPGVFRDGMWYLKNSLSGGGPDLSISYGRRGDVPVVGNWDGVGATGLGVVRGATWHLRNTLSSGVGEISLTYGWPGDVKITGDWDGDGGTDIGVVRGRMWHLKNSLSGGTADLSFAYGVVGDVPVTGDWDGDGGTDVGVVRGTSWFLRDSASGGVGTTAFTYGSCGDAVLTTASARQIAGVPPSLRGTEWTRLPTGQPVVALTFDAGGDANGLASILSTLQNTGTPATFFLTGAWTAANPAAARQIADRYPVGNHSVSHPDFRTLTAAEIRSQVAGADETVRTIAGKGTAPWFRFPFGERDARTIGEVNCLGYGSVRWTVDTLGWQGTSGGQSATTVLNRVLAGLSPGEIVLMHVGSNPNDGSTLDAQALPRIITELRNRGYGFVTLDQFR
jgi:peptidoglycan/xylan/chitin deacetylase (PgdA/CDA1 family)